MPQKRKHVRIVSDEEKAIAMKKMKTEITAAEMARLLSFLHSVKLTTARSTFFGFVFEAPYICLLSLGEQDPYPVWQSGFQDPISADAALEGQPRCVVQAVR